MWSSLRDNRYRYFLFNGRHSCRFRKFLFVFFLIALSGCASIGTYNPATGRREFIAISTPTEVKMGRDMHRRLLSQYKFIMSGPLLNKVRSIGARLAEVSDRKDYQYNFYVIKKDEMNAFTTPGGNIYIFTGLLNKLKDDNQIAAVIAHEMGHCAARHVVKKFQASLGYDLLGSLILSNIGMSAYARSIARLSSSAVMKLVSSAYSRHDEYEADRLGVKYMRLAGFNPKGMVEVLNILKKASGEPGGLIILRSHPYLKDRILAVQQEIMCSKK